MNTIIIISLIIFLLLIIYLYFYDDEPKSCMNLNSSCVCKLTLSKKKTNEFLRKYNYPVPKGFHVNSISDIDKQMMLYDIKYPLIIKPSDGTCGIDVISGISNITKLKDKSKELLKNNKELIVEEQLEGTVYRILYVNKKLVSIIGRDVPYIIGNGINTISELNDMRNDNLDRSQYKIKLNLDYINSQGYEINSIPKKGEMICVNNVLNYSGGAITYNYDLNRIHPKNKKLFDDLLSKHFDSNCLGVDFISKDLSVPYDENGGTIIEFNSNPSRKLHHVFHPNFSQYYNEAYDRK